MPQQRRFITLLFNFFFLELLFTTPAAAGVVDLIKHISLGTVDLHPGGDTIIINASSGPATPLATRSLVTGGGSGLLRFTSATAEHVDIIYPSSATLSDGSHTITISDIPANSEYDVGGFNLPGGGASVDVSIGGKVVLPGNTIYGNYSGTMAITINFS